MYFYSPSAGQCVYPCTNKASECSVPTLRHRTLAIGDVTCRLIVPLLWYHTLLVTSRAEKIEAHRTVSIYSFTQD